MFIIIKTILSANQQLKNLNKTTVVDVNVEIIVFKPLLIL